MKVFCDLDGTLIDVAPRHYRVYCEVTNMFGGTPLAQPIYWDLKRKKVKWPELLPLSRLSATIEREYLAQFIERIEAPAYLQGDTLFPGALSALDTLKQRGNECYLVSLRRNEANLLGELDGLGVSKYFSKVLSGHSESDGYDKKIQLISAELHDGSGLIVGDTEADIVTGKELGLMTVAVLSGIRDEQFLQALQPDHLLQSIAELAAVLPG